MLTLVTIGEFGSLRNLKSDESIAFYKALKRIDPQLRVICRDYKFNKRNKTFVKVVPFGNKIFKVISGLSRIFWFINERRITTLIYDSFARISKDSIVVTIPAMFYRITKKAKLSILYCATAHPYFEAKLSKSKPNHRYAKTLSAGDYLLVVSDFVKKTFSDEGVPPQKIIVIGIGVDIKKFKPGNKKDNKFRVLAVGNYNKLKGFQYLLEAWSELNLDNSELVLLGNPANDMKGVVNMYLRKIKNLRIVPFSNPIPYYHNASLLVHPSLVEGSSRVIMEGMACGLPIICTENSGSVVRDGKDGFIIPIKDKKAIKEKILYFYTHPQKMREMGRNAFELVTKRYKVEDFSQRIYEAVLDILKKEGLQ